MEKTTNLLSLKSDWVFKRIFGKEGNEDILAEWLMLLSGKGELIEMALSKNAEKIKKAYEELEYLSQDKAAREEYDAYQRAIIDEKMKIQYAEEKGEKRNLLK